MRIYIDDIRPAPEGWTQARTVTDAIRVIDMFSDKITDISFDHDISYSVEVAGTQRPFPSPENFTAVARFVEKIVRRDVKITIHTANPVGAKELEDILADFEPVVAPEMRVNRLESEV
jgi:hypothetical protein